jgi:hypothetical protein
MPALLPLATPGLPSGIGAVLGQKSKVQFIQPPTGIVFTVDASIKETHTRKSAPTKFPIENGANVSDHIIIEPFSLELVGIISDYPLSLLSSLVSTGLTAVLPPVGIQALAAGAGLYSALTSSKSPSVAAYTQLLSLQDAKMPFDVLTTLNRYTNMYISSLTVPRDVSNSNILEFTVNLEQLIIVSPATVNITIFGDPDTAASQADLGEQQANSQVLKGLKSGIGFTTSGIKSITGLNVGG